MGVTWGEINVPSRQCRGCGKRLKLSEVAHFGTAWYRSPVRFVECIPCFERGWSRDA